MASATIKEFPLSPSTIRQINEWIEKNRQPILDTADYIWKNPETGFKEWKTSAFLEKQLSEMGYHLTQMGNIPGFYFDLETHRPGPTLAVMAELDSIICAGHPAADPETAAVHACGHHTQCAYLIGVAMVLKNTTLLSQLCGKIRFIAVPAEELIELSYRSDLRKKNIIKYLGGKVEFLHRGVFDGVDAAFMLHSGGGGEKALTVYKGNNGCLAKNITYKGKAAHAGGGAHLAVNALYAATLGINAVNAIRETFKEENITRVHPIITQGGMAVNVIPETVVLESFVRGATPESMVNENKKVNRALAGAAVSIGSRLHINDIPGYMPLTNNPYFNTLMHEVGMMILGEERVAHTDRWNAASTDMGDLCCVMPVIHPSVGGGKGAGHSEDYFIEKPEVACLDSTKLAAGFICSLLGNNGKALWDVKENFSPMFKDYASYFNFIDALYSDRELVAYDGDTVMVTL